MNWLDVAVVLLSLGALAFAFRICWTIRRDTRAAVCQWRKAETSWKEAEASWKEAEANYARAAALHQEALEIRRSRR